MSDRDDVSICELIALWPIGVTLADGAWFTLWGGGGTETDLVLAQADRIVLSSSLGGLYDRVALEPTNMTALPTFPGMTAALRHKEWPMEYLAHHYRFDEISVWMRTAADGWSLEQADAVLNSLNLLWDVGRSVGDRRLEAALHPGGGVLGALMDGVMEAKGLLTGRRAPSEVTLRLRLMFDQLDRDALALAFEAEVSRAFGTSVRW